MVQELLARCPSTRWWRAASRGGVGVPGGLGPDADPGSGPGGGAYGDLMTQLIIDADTHITEPPDVWTARVPAQVARQVPHVVRNDEGRDVWVLDGTPFCSRRPHRGGGVARAVPRRADDVRGVPARRVRRRRRASRYMDEVGIWAQVLYPNVAGFGSQRFLSIRDDELKLVCVRAYNDFLRDWASADAAPAAHRSCRRRSGTSTPP